MNTNSESNEKCIDVCNSLLRGERSAIETYDKAIKKFEDQNCISTLREIKTTHVEAVGLLEQNVRSMGGQPDTDSGAWGTFANIVQSTANLFGEGSAINALQQGEEYGRDDYKDALENDDVHLECKELIRTKLLPHVLTNLGTLDSLEEVV